jgi:hypothetical protein
MLGAATPARGAGANDEAAAVTLVEEAKKLMSAGDYEHACPKLVEAHRLHPTAAKLLRLGDCYEKIGKLASAWGAFKQAEITARSANDADREQEGARRAKDLDAALSKLTITLTGVPAAGLEVRRDGALVGEGQLGTAVPVDAGEHVIEATAPGRRKWVTRVQVAAGSVSVAVSIPELPPEAGALPGPTSASPSFWSAQRIAGLTVGSFGVAGLAVGATLGGLAISKNNASKADCLPNQPNMCHADGVSLRLSARGFADASTGTTIAGGVALAAGIVVFVTSPSAASAQMGAARRVDVSSSGGIGTAGLWLRGEL